MKNEALIRANIVERYDTYGREYFETVGRLTLYDGLYDRLLGHIPPGGSCMDLACGPANVSFYLKRRRPDIRIHGMDLSPAMIQIAGERVPDGSFTVGDFGSFRPRKGEFDCIVFAFGLPYIPLDEFPPLLAAFREGLAPGGVAYLSFMEGDALEYEVTSFTKGESLYTYYHPKKEVLDMIASCGFTMLLAHEQEYPEEGGRTLNDVICIFGKG